jgi:hypothetical protein
MGYYLQEYYFWEFVAILESFLPFFGK